MTAPAKKRIRVMYFAWVRERIGMPSETVETDARTVDELIGELVLREDRYALAFSDLEAVRVAVDQELAEFGHRLDNVEELAFFPPMTGG